MDLQVSWDELKSSFLFAFSTVEPHIHGEEEAEENGRTVSWWAEDPLPLSLLFWAQLNLPGGSCPFLGGTWQLLPCRATQGRGNAIPKASPAAHFERVKKCRELLWGSALTWQPLISQQGSSGLMGRDGPPAPLQKARVRGHLCERVLYQHCSPALGFRVLLALGRVLIIKTCRGASEAASAAIQPAPGFQRKGIAKHLILGNTLESSDTATTSQGIPGTSANSGWNVFRCLKCCWPLLFLCGRRSETVRERERAEKADGLSKQRSDSLLRRQQIGVVLQWAV